MTDVSAHFPGLSFATLIAELLRELKDRIEANEMLISKGNITRDDANRQLAMIHAWKEDCQRIWQADAVKFPNPSNMPRQHRFTWIERRAALLRVLAQRERYPPAGDAAERNRCLFCLLSLYENGFDWQPHNGVDPAFGVANPTPDQQASRDEWRAIMAEVAARSRPEQQLGLGV